MMTTGVLLTRNRPDFLRRALLYYNGRYSHRIVILDASDRAQYEEISSSVAKLKLTYSIELLHHDVSAPWSQRMADGMEMVSSPYIMLMADDDFYYPNWLDEAIEYLESHPACSTVWGHVITFELAGFIPFGTVLRIDNNRANPVPRWMEHESPIDRLRELQKGPWGGNWWYSLQRTETFRKMAAQAHAARFPQDMFERMQSLLQPIYGKVVMLDSIYAARQVNPILRTEGFSFRTNQNSLAVLEEMAVSALMEASLIDRPRAQAIIRETLKPEIRMLKSTDLRRTAKIEELKRRLPFVARTVRALKATRNRLLRIDPLAPDPRFPPMPALSETMPEITLLKEACHGPVER